MRLYIIGNGLDLHNGMKTRYSDFRCFLKNICLETLKDFESLFPDYIGNDKFYLWNSVEVNLLNVGSESIVDTVLELVSTYSPPYSIEDWSDSYHHDAQYEVGEYVTKLKSILTTHLRSWINSVEVPSLSKTCLDSNSLFLTFNYTKTLESVYGICKDRIHYIHIKDDEYVFGNNDTSILGFTMENPINHSNGSDADVRAVESFEIAEDAVKELGSIFHKNVGYIIENHDFFKLDFSI